ncbi:MAG: hypothetical protein JXJ04_12690 [Spirochaetales bacterium]|nr:hypothetical protein [Spirochaetales bacterium]
MYGARGVETSFPVGAMFNTYASRHLNMPGHHTCFPQAAAGWPDPSSAFLQSTYNCSYTKAEAFMEDQPFFTATYT